MSIIKTVYVDDIEMKYGAIGHGKKSLVVLPGIYLKSVVDSVSSLETQFAAFLDEYTLYFFDRRTNSPIDYTLKQMSLDTAKVIKYIGLDSVDIYGVSQGGMMALYLAIYAKEIVNKICVVSTAVKLNQRMKKVLKSWSEFAKERDIETLVRNFVENVYSKPFVEANEEILVEAFKDTSDKEMNDFYINNEAFFTLDLEKDLDKIDCPLFVIAVNDNRICGIKAISDLVKKTGCKYHYYMTNEAHAVYDENPDVLIRVREFLKI